MEKTIGVFQKAKTPLPKGVMFIVKKDIDGWTIQHGCNTKQEAVEIAMMLENCAKILREDKKIWAQIGQSGF
jgi:hypothetical protein